jgi:hypothetical protein
MSDYAIRNQDYKRRNTLTKTKKARLEVNGKQSFSILIHLSSFAHPAIILQIWIQLYKGQSTDTVY